MPNHALFLGDLEGLNPLKLWVAIKTPKGTSLGENASFKPSVQGFELGAIPRKQELSYRKQIARQLRTQYVEGLYDNPVT